jgi:hypothetical protein
VPNVLSTSAEDMLTQAKWRTLSWRKGTKGRLKARFAAVRVRVADGPPQRIGDKGMQHMPGDEVWLVGERRASGEQKYYLANLPADADLKTLAATIKARWVCEQAHQQLKEELGLDHFEGRSWRGLHRHALMAMIAYAFLQHLRLAAASGGKKISAGPPQPTLPAIRKAVVVALARAPHTDAHTAAAKSVDHSIESATVVLKRHLGLDGQRNELALFGCDQRLPDLGPAAAVDEGRAADDGRAGGRGSDKIGLALERCRSLRFRRKVDERRGGAQRVGEAHDRPAMADIAKGAKLRPDRHPRGESVLFGADELDPEQFRERQRVGVDAVEKRHLASSWRWPGALTMVGRTGPEEMTLYHERAGSPILYTANVHFDAQAAQACVTNGARAA